MPNERTPLLWQSSYQDQPATAFNAHDSPASNQHDEFCMMVGVPSSAPTPDGKHHSTIPAKSLYGRATRHLSSQKWTYYGTATLSNGMLLTQVMLGAALTALGASESSHILITVFGALNTVIAGLVAYLKSRGQPMRARMYRDDLERVVDEIENSEVMWLGIAKGVHGYEDIDTGTKQDGKDGKDGGYERNPNAVTVRSEVARLTRLFDRAVRNNTVNNPDMYMTGGGDGGSGGATLRNRIGGGAAAPVSIVTPVVSAAPGAPAPQPPVEQPHDPDESPASAPAPVAPKPKEEKKPEQEDVKPEVKKAGEEAKSDETKGKTKAEGDVDGSGTLSKAPAPADKPQSEEATSAAPSAPSPSPAPAPAGPSEPAKQEAARDPDAEPASDPSVPLKKVAGSATDAKQ